MSKDIIDGIQNRKLNIYRIGGAMKFQTIFEPTEDGGFTVYVPSLPGCISEGNTYEEALSNIREAIELYLEPVDDDFVRDENTRLVELEL